MQRLILMTHQISGSVTMKEAFPVTEILVPFVVVGVQTEVSFLVASFLFSDCF